MIVFAPWPRTTTCTCGHRRQARCHTIHISFRRGGCRCTGFQLLYKIRRISHEAKPGAAWRLTGTHRKEIVS